MTNAATKAWDGQEQRHCTETIRKYGYLLRVKWL